MKVNKNKKADQRKRVQADKGKKRKITNKPLIPKAPDATYKEPQDPNDPNPNSDPNYSYFPNGAYPLGPQNED
jgi:hypothetical protein